MSDLSPEATDTARNAAERVGRYAGRTLLALQASTGTPVTALVPVLEALRDAAGDLATADPRIVVAYDPATDEAALRLLADNPTYVPSSLAELDSDFTLLDRQALSALLSKWMFSNVFPVALDDPSQPLLQAVNRVVDELEGT